MIMKYLFVDVISICISTIVYATLITFLFLLFQLYLAPTYMSIFSHISVFISLILGLSVVHLLSGFSLILDTRKESKIYWVHVLWTFNMLLTVVLVWLSSFVLSPLNEISVIHFINLLAYSIVTYLMSALLYPVQGEEVTDFLEHFDSNYKRFSFLGILFVLVDGIDGLLEHFEAGIPIDIGQFATLGIWLILFTSSLFFQNRTFKAIVSIVYTIGLLGWLHSLIDTGVLSW